MSTTVCAARGTILSTYPVNPISVERNIFSIMFRIGKMKGPYAPLSVNRC
jgi:hypothetical protein